MHLTKLDITSTLLNHTYIQIFLTSFQKSFFGTKTYHELKLCYRGEEWAEISVTYLVSGALILERWRSWGHDRGGLTGVDSCWNCPPGVHVQLNPAGTLGVRDITRREEARYKLLILNTWVLGLLHHWVGWRYGGVLHTTSPSCRDTIYISVLFFYNTLHDYIFNWNKIVR